MLPVQQLLARLLQGVDAALVGRQLGLERLVLLHFALQVGGVLHGEDGKMSTYSRRTPGAVPAILKILKMAGTAPAVLPEPNPAIVEASAPCTLRPWPSSSSR